MYVILLVAAIDFLSLFSRIEVFRDLGSGKFIAGQVAVSFEPTTFQVRGKCINAVPHRWVLKK